MPDLAPFTRLVPLDHGLADVSTRNADGSIQSTVVTAGVSKHPVTGAEVVAFVAAGGTKKLDNLRADAQCTVCARAGWEWATVEGTAEIIGPDDPSPSVDADALRLLLRQIFTDAGGSHDDWDEYDRVMRQERRAAVLVTPRRVYGVAR